MRVYDPYVIAAGFPAGLNTSTPETELEANETSDGYGFSLALDDRLATGTIPSGTSRIAVTKTITAVNYSWYYNRLWRFSGNILYYGAPFYDDVYLPQRLGAIVFDEDSSDIVQILPFGQDNIMVLKSTGSYVLSNCSDSRGLFQRTDIIQEMAVSTAANCIDLNGIVYVSNANGIFAYIDGHSVEITRKIRTSLTGLVNNALTCDYNKQYLIAGSALVFEPATQKLFKYSSSSFRFTSRQFHLPDYAPFAVDRVIFIVEHNTEDDGTLTYQIKFEDEDWSDTFDVELKSSSERFTVQEEVLQSSRSCRRFQIRITSLSSNKYIKQIRLDTQAFNFDGYST